MDEIMPANPDPIQAQLIDARRNQILDAATEVFAAKGFHGATIRQIAQTAGIADGTIYLYFKTKTDLLLGILDRINESEQRADDLAQPNEGDFADFFAVYLRHRMKRLDENFQALRAILPDILSQPELRSRYYSQVIEPTFVTAEPIFRTWIAQGILKPLDPTLALRAISGMVFGLLVMRMLGDPVIEEQWEQFPEVLAPLLLQGIRAS
ncbi:MAG TPA: TetR/AcrR family transcriptional regulator [Caldilineaceae bacterium]|nr:TetR/AcrR family transcriptional regulator [Caldilineaceae bacterium]